MAKMKKLGLIFFALMLLPKAGQTLTVTHEMKTLIGVFDACEETFSYAFYRDKDYDIKTSVTTTGTFGLLYPFKATYHTAGTYDKFDFKPQDYYYETQSRFKHRTKEIVYKNGIPQYRVSTKETKKRTDNIEIDNAYTSHIDLLSTFGVLAQRIINKGKCDMEQYSFNGKKYSKSTVKTIGREKIKTDYFEGKALKCQYELEVLEDADAGFLVDGKEPIYFWILQDKQTQAYFLAKILIESTPFGKLEAITTHIEVTK